MSILEKLTQLHELNTIISKKSKDFSYLININIYKSLIDFKLLERMADSNSLMIPTAFLHPFVALVLSRLKMVAISLGVRGQLCILHAI